MHSMLFYRKHLAGGFGLFWRQIVIKSSSLPIISRLRNRYDVKSADADKLLSGKYTPDVHCRLMSVYPEGRIPLFTCFFLIKYLMFIVFFFSQFLSGGS
jgi:hypothetical protein